MITIQTVTKKFQDKKTSVTALKHVSFSIKKEKPLLYLERMEQARQRFYVLLPPLFNQQKEL